MPAHDRQDFALMAEIGGCHLSTNSLGARLACKGGWGPDENGPARVAADRWSAHGGLAIE